MKKSVIASLIFSLFYSTTHAETIVNSSLDSDIEIQCVGACDPYNAINSYIAHRKLFSRDDQKIVVKENGSEIFSTTIAEYFPFLDNRTYPGTNSLANIPSDPRLKETRSDLVTVLDTPLSCEYDNDYSCEDWSDNELANEISNYIASRTLRFRVTQEQLDGCSNSVNYAASILLGAISIPATSALIARYGLQMAGQQYLGAVVGTVSWDIANNISDAICISYSEPGDWIEISNGQVIVYPDDPHGSGGGELGQGGSETGYNPGDYYDGSSYQCRYVYTGASGNYTRRWTCYFG